MAQAVILNVVKGSLAGRQYQFTEPSTCLIGRSPDCNICLPSDEAHATVSRHHCLLDIAPPQVRIRDFGSLNGTFVNGKNIGQRAQTQSADAADKDATADVDIASGDKVRVGETEIEVLIQEVAGSGQSADEIGVSAPCEEEEAGTGEAVVSPAVMGKDPLALVEAILEQARAGNAQFQGIEGYYIRKELGRGGMGAVYLAEHKATGDQVALKVLLPQAATNKRAVRMFLREAENSKTLDHDNVVRVHDTGFSEGTFYISMEYCNRQNVRELVDKRGGKIPPEEAVDIALQVLDGLQYIHTATIPNVQLADGTVGQGTGLVHRDMKPSNIFLHKQGDAVLAKIADVGLAKAFDLAGLSGQTRTGQAAGSPLFMPRQQVIQFKYAKPEVDVWGLAATLYYMLSGGYPREFQSGKDPWLTVLQTQPTPILLKESSVPAKLAEVIDTALVDYPELTFTSALEFRKALEGAV
ncbi:MAG: FHA domain-containing protein [Desulfovibrio sp.]|nr:MAG: FHA domain-containing protein [Desulfovibrio sp.]